MVVLQCYLGGGVSARPGVVPIQDGAVLKSVGTSSEAEREIDVEVVPPKLQALRDELEEADANDPENASILDDVPSGRVYWTKYTPIDPHVYPKDPSKTVPENVDHGAVTSEPKKVSEEATDPKTLDHEAVTSKPQTVSEEASDPRTIDHRAVTSKPQTVIEAGTEPAAVTTKTIDHEAVTSKPQTVSEEATDPKTIDHGAVTSEPKTVSEEATSEPNTVIQKAAEPAAVTKKTNHGAVTAKPTNRGSEESDLLEDIDPWHLASTLPPPNK